MILKRAKSANWFTPEGVMLKRAQIRKRGVPDMKDWRFFTLTIDPSLFDSPEDALLAGKDRMRRWLAGMRELLSCPGARWCWKLEFHQSGWPHWHVCFEYRRKMTKSEMVAVKLIWGLGETDTQRIRCGSFDYVFKYVTKGGEIPDWFLDYYVRDEDGRGRSFQRTRFWQTSVGFYTGDPPSPRPPSGSPRSSLLSVPVRRYVADLSRKARVIAQDHNGRPCKSATVYLRRPWKGAVDRALAMFCLSGRAAAPGTDRYIVGSNLLEKLCLQTNRPALAVVSRHQRMSERRQIETYLRRMGVAAPF